MSWAQRARKKGIAILRDDRKEQVKAARNQMDEPTRTNLL